MHLSKKSHVHAVCSFTQLKYNPTFGCLLKSNMLHLNIVQQQMDTFVVMKPTYKNILRLHLNRALVIFVVFYLFRKMSYIFECRVNNWIIVASYRIPYSLIHVYNEKRHLSIDRVHTQSHRCGVKRSS